MWKRSFRIWFILHDVPLPVDLEQRETIAKRLGSSQSRAAATHSRNPAIGNTHDRAQHARAVEGILSCDTIPTQCAEKRPLGVPE
jgi:hypothetical protein